MRGSPKLVGAALGLILLSCTRPDGDTALAPEEASTPAAGVFVDITDESGVSFVHPSDPIGACWLPDQLGSGGTVVDSDGGGDLDLYLVQTGLVSEQQDA